MTVFVMVHFTPESAPVYNQPQSTSLGFTFSKLATLPSLAWSMGRLTIETLLLATIHYSKAFLRCFLQIFPRFRRATVASRRHPTQFSFMLRGACEECQENRHLSSMAIPRQSHGNHMAIAWQSHGSCLFVRLSNG